jgi:hypothetical protein
MPVILVNKGGGQEKNWKKGAEKEVEIHSRPFTNKRKESFYLGMNLSTHVTNFFRRF